MIEDSISSDINLISENEEPLPVILQEPWRCSECKELFYLVDFEPVKGSRFPKKVPKAGAPRNFYIVSGKVCSLCFEMFWAVKNSPYHRKAHEDWAEEQTKRKRQIDKLKTGGTYFPGE